MPLTERQKQLLQFERLGVNQVRQLIGEWSGSLRMEAINWVAEKDQDAARVAEEYKAEQMEVARSAKDAALEANSIAREASGSAARSAQAARTNNTIATLALIAAVIAIAISIMGIFIKR